MQFLPFLNECLIFHRKGENEWATTESRSFILVFDIMPIGLCLIHIFMHAEDNSWYEKVISIITCDLTPVFQIIKILLWINGILRWNTIKEITLQKYLKFAIYMYIRISWDCKHGFIPKLTACWAIHFTITRECINDTNIDL